MIRQCLLSILTLIVAEPVLSGFPAGVNEPAGGVHERPGADLAADPQGLAGRILAMPSLVTLIRFPASGDWLTTGGSLPGMPVFLRRIGDPKRYTAADWPDAGRLRFDQSGPFGNALCCDRGLLYAEIPREHFDGKPLDIHGRRSGTLVAWAKFTGQRHMVAGIWDEGNWDRYAGRRQYALFGGLFGTKGLTAHISTTGAASFPQSPLEFAKYANDQAIDGADFVNNQWLCLAMTWDAATQTVTAYVDGVATPLQRTVAVIKDVYREHAPTSSNPFHFPWPMFGPRHFVLKFNGYDLARGGIAEHWVECDLAGRRLAYGRAAPVPAAADSGHLVRVELMRGDKSLLPQPLRLATLPDAKATPIPEEITFAVGDVVRAVLTTADGTPVGRPVQRVLAEGAPFTIGRALGLGLGKEDQHHGSQVTVDGVAVFDRALDAGELRAIVKP
jgi:hypothetical protein